MPIVDRGEKVIGVVALDGPPGSAATLLSKTNKALVEESVANAAALVAKVIRA